MIYSIVLFVGFSCNSANTDKIPDIKLIDYSSYIQDSTLIVGSWKWNRSTYYYTSTGKPYVETPISTHSTKVLIIKNDWTVELYKNNNLQETKSLDSFLGSQFWGVLDDTLVTSTAHVDGPEKVYLRIK